MHYSDQTRRFNYASGLVLGLVVGTGIALIAAPRVRRRRGLLRG